MRLLVAIFFAVLLAARLVPGGYSAFAQGTGIDPVLLKKAEAGDADAQVKLGNLLVKGNSVPRDFNAAEKWFERAAAQHPIDALAAGLAFQQAKAYQLARIWLHRAAEQKSMTAYLYLANMYSAGKGGLPDFEKAETYFRLLAEAGLEDAWGRIGEFYYKGSGRPRDFFKARAFFRRASEKNDYAIRLAEMNLNGLGGPRDLGAAAKWYKKVAMSPDTSVMHLLGTLYQSGELSDADGQSMALTWFLLATAFGHEDAELLVRRMNVRIPRSVALEATKRARTIAKEALFQLDILAYLDQAETYFRK